MSVYLSSMFKRCGVSPCVILNDKHRQHIFYIAPSELKSKEEIFIKEIIDCLPAAWPHRHAFLVKKIQAYSFIGFCTKSLTPENFALRTGHIVAWGIAIKNGSLLSGFELLCLIKAICVMLSAPMRIKANIAVVEEVEKYRKFPNSDIFLDAALADIFLSLDECLGYRHQQITLDRKFTNFIRYFNRWRASMVISTNRSSFFQEFDKITGANIATPLIAWYEMNYPSKYLIFMPDFNQDKSPQNCSFILSKKSGYSTISRLTSR